MMRVRWAEATGCPVGQFVISAETPEERQVVRQFLALSSQRERWQFWIHGMGTDGFNFGWLDRERFPQSEQLPEKTHGEKVAEELTDLLDIDDLRTRAKIAALIDREREAAKAEGAMEEREACAKIAGALHLEGRHDVILECGVDLYKANVADTIRSRP